MASSLEGNKLLAGVLTAGIIAMGAGTFARIVYNPHGPAEPAFTVAPAAPAGATAPEPEKPIGVLMAAADPAAGANTARQCGACHSFDKGGANKVGPNLWDKINHPIGKHEGFSYSSAMAEHGGNWDYDALNHFLANPKAYVPGTKMSYAGIAKPEQRANVIAYLRSLSDSPAPLPPTE